MNNKIIPLIFGLIVCLNFSLVGGTVFANEAAPGTVVEQTRQGDTFFQQGHFQSAAKSWENSLAGIDCAQNAAQCIEVLTRLAAAYQALGMHRAMFLRLEYALSLANFGQNAGQRALVNSQLSDAWLSVGASEIARSLDTSADKVVPHAPEKEANEADATVPKYLRKALLLAETSVRDATLANNPSILARALNTQGNVWVVRAQKSTSVEAYKESIQKASEAYQKSRQAAEKAGDTALAIKASLNRLNLVVMNDESSPVERLNTLGRLWKQIKTLPNSYDKARYLLSLGIFALNVLQEDKFLKQEQQVTQELLQERGCVGTNSQTIELSPVTDSLFACLPEDEQRQTSENVILLTEEDLEKTHQLLEQKGFTKPERQRALYQAYFAFQNALRIAKDLQNAQTMSVAYGHLGQLYEEEERYDEALTLTRRAIFFATQSHLPYSNQRHDVALTGHAPASITSHFSHRLYRWYWQQGRILKTQGKREQAIQAYRLASVNLKPIQQLLDVGYRLPPDLFGKVVKPVHYGLADLLLQQAKTISNEPEQQSFLREAIETVELVKVAELQDYFQDECVTALQSKTISILDSQKMPPQLQRELQHTAILYPIPLEDRLVVVISVAGKLHQKSVAVTANEVNQTALELRANLQTRPHNHFMVQAQQLYKWLITPFEARLAAHKIDTLVVVPDGNLRMIPFSTLHDGEQFLVEKYAMSLTPGLKLVNPQRVQWDDSQIFLVGLSEAVQGHSPLSNVLKELSNIQRIAAHLTSQRILNQDYSFKNFRTQIKQHQYSVIHLATHGEFDADPEHTYLLTYHDKMKMDDLQEAISLGRFREKQLELLTLSACKTAVGDDKAALGLAGVAVKAGAKSAIATLWYVDDEATSVAISEFYQQLFLNRGFSKAKALQETQKKLLKIKRYWHPSYWAPFLLIGNWL
jgi:CHAT domain-containing protein